MLGGLRAAGGGRGWTIGNRERRHWGPGLLDLQGRRGYGVRLLRPHLPSLERGPAWEVAPHTYRQLLQFKGLKFQLVWRRRGAGDS